MHVVSRKALRAFSTTHADAGVALDTWYRVPKAATWTNLAEVRRVYPATDLVNELTVFDIKGTSYRLVVRMNYRNGMIFVRGVYTHAEYDRGTWKQ
jgi:mRNA interferase HigB